MPVACDAPAIVNVLILDKAGARICAKYFTDRFQSTNAQLNYEKVLFSKAQKQPSTSDAEILIYEGLVTVYKSQGEVTFFVTGDQDENEIILVRRNVMNLLMILNLAKR
jgi:coatomer subunit zeta